MTQCYSHVENPIKFTSSDPFLPVCCRSAIHGRGLFCKRNIEAGEMVIEYAGIVIRSVLTDKREKYYDSKVGCTSGFLISFLVIHFINWFFKVAKGMHHFFVYFCRALAVTCSVLMTLM